MGTFASNEAKITLKLDVDEAKEALRKMKAEMSKMPQGKAAGLAPASKPGATSPAPQSANQSKVTRNMLDSVIKRLEGRMQGAVPGLGAASRVSQALGGPNLQTAASFTEASGAASGLLRVAGAAALTYGAARVASTAGIGFAEALQGLLPDLLENNPVFKIVKDTLDIMSKKMDNLENSVVAAFVAAKQTKDITSAAAQLTGKIPNVGYYYSQEYDISRQSRNLDDAFDRFKYKGMAKALGTSLRELTRGSLEQ